MNRYQAVNRSPGFLVSLTLKLHNLFSKAVHGSALFDSMQYMHSNRVPFKNADTGQISLWIEIVIVTTSKDFTTLPLCVSGGLQSVKNFEKVTVAIYVPDHEVSECKALFSESEGRYLEIFPESLLVSKENIGRLRDHFQNRAGWVLQQCLKVVAVLRSNANGVLIIDSDTILTKTRNWLDPLGHQILTPTIDRHPSYYKFLVNNNVIKNERPEFPLVPHHTLMQPKYFNELIDRFFMNFDGLFETLFEYDIAKEQSPFCIEYELYGQYMWHFHPEKIKLEKWANISLERESFLDINGKLQIPYKIRDNYASVSFHDWQSW
jgi:hypothetical protein